MTTTDPRLQTCLVCGLDHRLLDVQDYYPPEALRAYELRHAGRSLTSRVLAAAGRPAMEANLVREAVAEGVETGRLQWRG